MTKKRSTNVVRDAGIDVTAREVNPSTRNPERRV
jgi:hypothetical protein